VAALRPVDLVVVFEEDDVSRRGPDVELAYEGR
jgi:hypothetical protein